MQWQNITFCAQKNKIKATNVKNNCIVKTKIIDKIQCTKIHKDYNYWNLYINWLINSIIMFVIIIKYIYYVQ